MPPQGGDGPLAGWREARRPRRVGQDGGARSRAPELPAAALPVRRRPLAPRPRADAFTARRGIRRARGPRRRGWHRSRQEGRRACRPPWRGCAGWRVSLRCGNSLRAVSASPQKSPARRAGTRRFGRGCFDSRGAGDAFTPAEPDLAPGGPQRGAQPQRRLRVRRRVADKSAVGGRNHDGATGAKDSPPAAVVGCA